MGAFRTYLTTLIYLATAVIVQASETIFSVDVAKNYFYGEIFHIASAAKLDPNVYIYIPTISGVDNPQQNLARLKSSISQSEKRISETRWWLDREVNSAVEYLKSRPRAVGENSVHVEFKTPKGTVQTKVPLWNSEEIWQQIRDGRTPSLPPTIKEKMTPLIRRYQREMKTLQAFKQEAKIAEKGLLFSSFLEDAGLKKKIIPYTIPHIPGDNEIIPSLIGRTLPDGKKIKTPVRRFLYNSTQIIVKRMNEDPSLAKKTIRNSFLSKRTQADLSPVHRYANETIISKIPKNRSGRAIWNRLSDFQPERNMTEQTLLRLFKEAKNAGEVPILFGPSLPKEWEAARRWISDGTAVNAAEHWLNPAFSETKESILRQLELFDYLKNQGKLSSQIGMMGGVMDGVALTTHLPTTALTIEDLSRGRIDDFAHALGNYKMLQIAESKASSASCLSQNLGLLFAEQK